MKSAMAISILFWIAAAYDGVLGAAFLVFSGGLFAHFDVPPPNHMAYVQFPAALLLVFALMFAAVALKPTANRNLIPYGILLKVSYCGVAFSYWLTEGIPTMWKPFAIIDVVFAALFCWAYCRLVPRTQP
jgi:hypothetical protein